jgi:hypothetical protein
VNARAVRTQRPGLHVNGRAGSGAHSSTLAPGGAAWAVQP